MASEDPPACDLSCENGGYCTLIPGPPSYLSKLASAGSLLAKCICRPGFGGLSCEHAIEQCPPDEGDGGRCHNGVPCKARSREGGGEVRYECDCGVARDVSMFAYEMCTRPATEYCGRVDRFQANSFCTNGGSCAGNLGLRIEDTGPHQHEGCVCPPEFHGPHCEYLLGYGPPPEVSPLAYSGERRPAAKFVVIIVVVGACAALLLLVRAVRRRGRGARRDRTALEDAGRELSLQEDADDMKEDAEEDDETEMKPYRDAPPPEREEEEEEDNFVGESVRGSDDEDAFDNDDDEDNGGTRERHPSPPEIL